MFRLWVISRQSVYYHPMHDTKIVIILSVVATVLVLGIGVCIVINPLAAIGLAPVLAAISLIIRAIAGAPIEPDDSYVSTGTTRADLSVMDVTADCRNAFSKLREDH